MTDLAEEALSLWGMRDARCEFVAGRENRVYRVRSANGDFALRIKRPGYRSETELLSELQWMSAMGRAGLHVPQPLRSVSGRLLEALGETYVDMITWLPGNSLGKSGHPIECEDARLAFHGLGQALAELHAASDAWEPPAGFVRCSWDGNGLVGENPVWGRFWENPTLDDETRDLFAEFRRLSKLRLSEISGTLDFGLIHADPVRENVLVDGKDVRLIDFDDGGFGYRMFDIATALLPNMNEPDYPDLKSELIAGYRELHPLDDAHLDLFLALRAVTYVGWIVPRMDEDGAEERNVRFIQRARKICAEYLR